jgi:hypothetical protein
VSGFPALEPDSRHEAVSGSMCAAVHANTFASLKIAVVGQQRSGPAKLFQQSTDLLQHRRDLLLEPLLAIPEGFWKPPPVCAL